MGIRDDRAGHHVHGGSPHLADQVEAGREVAPLVGTTCLKHHTVFVVQVQEVVALQHLIAEFSEGDAFFRVETTGDGLFAEHGAEPEVLADIAQEVDDRHVGDPVVVVDETHTVVAFGIKETRNLRT